MCGRIEYTMNTTEVNKLQHEIKKTAWDVLRNFDHALILREDEFLRVIEQGLDFTSKTEITD